MAKQTLDYHAMYIVAGDIVGSIGRYSNTLSSISGKVDSANSTIDKARKYNGKWVYDGEKKSGDKTYKIYKQININDSAARSNLNVLSNRIERGVKDLKSLRNEANESEAVAAGIKAHVKKMQATLDPSDIAKIWSKLGLSIDLNNAVNGNKVGISDKGEDWDGLITFKRVSDKNGGIYLVLKNGIAMGYCTAEQKKSYYKELCKNNKNIKKMVDDETTERTKDTQKYANKMKANADYYDQASRERMKRNDDANPTILEKTGADFKGDGADKLPDDVKKLVDFDFKNKDGLQVKKAGQMYLIYDKSGKLIGSYSYVKTPLGNVAMRIPVNAPQAVAQFIGAKAAYKAGAGEGMLSFGEDAVDSILNGGEGIIPGAKQINDIKRQIPIVKDFQKKIDDFVSKDHAAELYNKKYWNNEKNIARYSAANSDFSRAVGKAAGKTAAAAGTANIVSGGGSSEINANKYYNPDEIIDVPYKEVDIVDDVHRISKFKAPAVYDGNGVSSNGVKSITGNNVKAITQTKFENWGQLRDAYKAGKLSYEQAFEEIPSITKDKTSQATYENVLGILAKKSK